MSPPLLGCIADDFTGATDLASTLVRSGMRVIQTMGVPRSPLVGDANAVVVALKTRTVPAREAVAQSLEALVWLRQQGGVQALGVTRMRIGSQIAPGVPWCRAPAGCAPGGSLHIALKAGHFGARDFLTQAFDRLNCPGSR